MRPAEKRVEKIRKVERIMARIDGTYKRKSETFQFVYNGLFKFSNSELDGLIIMLDTTGRMTV